MSISQEQKSFSGGVKRISIIFKGLSVLRNCLRPESTTLKFGRFEPGDIYKLSVKFSSVKSDEIFDK